MSHIKTNPELYRKRFLDVINKTGTGQDFYTPRVFEELSKNYKLKE